MSVSISIGLVLLLAAAAALAIGLLQSLRPLRARIHRKGKTSLALASLMFGFGSVLDPPMRHVIEAKEAKAEDDDPGGDPPDPLSGGPCP